MNSAYPVSFEGIAIVAYIVIGLVLTLYVSWVKDENSAIWLTKMLALDFRGVAAILFMMFWPLWFSVVLGIRIYKRSKFRSPDDSRKGSET